MLRGVVYLVVMMVLGYVLFVVHIYYVSPRLNQEVQIPEDQQAKAQRRHDLVIHVADDGKTTLQHRFMAHAILNLSDRRGGMSIKEIHQTKLALAAPSQEKGHFSPRSIVAAELLEKSSITGDPENLKSAGVEVDRVLKERLQDYDKEPCLSSILKYFRPIKWGTTQDAALMGREMATLFTDKQGGAIFYGPEGSKNICPDK